MLYVHGMADSSGAAKQAQCVKNSLNTCVQSINLHHQRLDTVCVLLRTVNYAKLTTQSREKAWQATVFFTIQKVFLLVVSGARFH